MQVRQSGFGCEKHELSEAKVQTGFEICKAMQLSSPPSHYLCAI